METYFPPTDRRDSSWMNRWSFPSSIHTCQRVSYFSHNKCHICSHMSKSVMFSAKSVLPLGFKDHCNEALISWMNVVTMMRQYKAIWLKFDLMSSCRSTGVARWCHRAVGDQSWTSRDVRNLYTKMTKKTINMKTWKNETLLTFTKRASKHKTAFNLVACMASSQNCRNRRCAKKMR